MIKKQKGVSLIVVLILVLMGAVIGAIAGGLWGSGKASCNTDCLMESNDKEQQCLVDFMEDVGIFEVGDKGYFNQNDKGFQLHENYRTCLAGVRAKYRSCQATCSLF